MSESSCRYTSYFNGCVSLSARRSLSRFAPLAVLLTPPPLSLVTLPYQVPKYAFVGNKDNDKEEKDAKSNGVNNGFAALGLDSDSD